MLSFAFGNRTVSVPKSSLTQRDPESKTLLSRLASSTWNQGREGETITVDVERGVGEAWKGSMVDFVEAWVEGWFHTKKGQKLSSFVVSKPHFSPAFLYFPHH